MYDKDDPLDESEDLGQHNQDLEEAGHGDQVNSTAGTIAGAAGTLLTAGMLLGPRLTLQRRRQRVREWVCTPVFFWKAYLPIENTLNGKRPRIGP